MINTIKQQEIPVDYENASDAMKEAILERIPDNLKSTFQFEEDPVLNAHEVYVLTNNLGFETSTIDANNSILIQSLKILVSLYDGTVLRKTIDKHKLECEVEDKANEVLGEQEKYEYEHKSQEILNNYLATQPKDYTISNVDFNTSKYIIKLYTNTEDELNKLYEIICGAGYYTALVHNTQIFKLTENAQYYLMLLINNSSDIDVILRILKEYGHYSNKEIIDLFKIPFRNNEECNALLNKYYLSTKDLYCYKGEEIYKNLPDYNNDYVSAEIERAKTAAKVPENVLECIVNKYKQANELLKKNKKELSEELKRRKTYVEEQGIEQLLKGGGLRANFTYDEENVEITETVASIDENYHSISIEKRLPIECWQMCLIQQYL